MVVGYSSSQERIRHKGLQALKNQTALAGSARLPALESGKPENTLTKGYTIMKNQIKHEAYLRLTKCFNNGKGHSRHEDKKTGKDKDRIYTDKTYHDYIKISKGFANWVKAQYPQTKHLKQTKKYVDGYLQYMIDKGLSSYTIGTRKAALMKLFGANSGDFISVPKRKREDITRSRVPAKRDKHLSEAKRKYYEKITDAIGCRRSELTRVRGRDLRYSKKTGKYYVYFHAGTKGGRPRYAELLDDTGEIIEMFRLAGDRQICPQVSEVYDNHSRRAVYAQKLYTKYARPVDQIPKEDRYIMRGDMKGVILDRKAMKYVSEALGHSRINVFAGHYAYTILHLNGGE
jgi:hypothetical protein